MTETRNGRRKQNLTVGVASAADFKERLLASARGEKISNPETKIWVADFETLARLLTAENRELMRAIDEAKPDSVSHLAKIINRDQGNVSRSLSKLAAAGLVKMVAHGREKRPELAKRTINLQIDLLSAEPRIAVA